MAYEIRHSAALTYAAPSLPSGKSVEWAARTDRYTQGTRARVLTSVVKPYVVDDEDGIRATNSMELYHNQMTRQQGQPLEVLADRAPGRVFAVSVVLVVLGIVATFPPVWAVF